ncbi:DUF3987 domain-containing protein [Mangrovimicrobium sediminis]|uniref:DUF3987 domain-containing protein n=1 Tax=Mangrovimicrobium sediminis TaxID=2562682 RepID=A0A4Z0M3Z7_9GAMM|nr:YfjI family protein [Haliea sp. SAOS-164]TGD74157.1 DUF3987 domain-containing protein [Haliea sp. SAOS-164]
MNKAHDMSPKTMPQDLAMPQLLEVADRLQYPLALLGPLLGDAATAIAEAVQAPPEIAANSTLAVAAFAAQDKANVVMDGRRYPLSLFLLTVAESGDRKTACDRVASQPLDIWQRARAESHRQALKQYRDEVDIYEAERRDALSKKNSGVEKIAALEALQAPEPPPEPMVICQEPTLEGLQRSFRQGWPSQALFNDEGGQFFGGHAMNPENVLKTIAGLSRYWDGSPIIRTRAARGESATMYDRRLSIHLQAQPRVAAAVLSDQLLVEQGILARFLVTEARTQAGTRLYRGRDPFQSAEVQRFHQRIQALLSHVPELDEGGGLILPDIQLSGDATSHWIDTYNATERAQAPGAVLELVKPAASKAAENALRIAGVFAVLENTGEITGEQMARAWSLAQYYLNGTLRAAQLAEQNVAEQSAHEVLDWLQGRKNGRATIEEMSKLLTPKRHRKSVAHIRAVLALLTDTGMVRVVTTNTRNEPAAWEVLR